MATGSLRLITKIDGSNVFGVDITRLRVFGEKGEHLMHDLTPHGLNEGEYYLFSKEGDCEARYTGPVDMEPIVCIDCYTEGHQYCSHGYEE